MQGGPPCHGLKRNELLLKKACGSNDSTRLAIIVANYTSESSFINHLLHLEIEEVFGSIKRPTTCPISANNDSHHLDLVNFSCPRVIALVVVPNKVEDVCMQQLPFGPNNLLPLVF